MGLKGEGELAAVLRFHTGAQEVLWLSTVACDVFKSVLERLSKCCWEGFVAVC